MMPEVERAQARTIYEIDGDQIARIPMYGFDTCRDCGAMRGQLHIPGCDAEECPKCHKQAVVCGCALLLLEPEPKPTRSSTRWAPQVH
jgi:hypothetical protein